MFTTYILYSNSFQKFYTGQTEDLNRRLEEHNRGKTPFMAKGIPWMLVFSKAYDSRTEAMKLEKFIKKRGASRFLKDNEITVGYTRVSSTNLVSHGSAWSLGLTV